MAVLFVPDSGQPIDITGWSLRWQLRPADGSPTIAINKDNGPTGGLRIVDAKYGLIQLDLVKGDTINLPLQTGPWFFELRRTDNGASSSLARGTLMIDSFNATP